MLRQQHQQQQYLSDSKPRRFSGGVFFSPIFRPRSAAASQSVTMVK
jgi:hypothetical protein